MIDSLRLVAEINCISCNVRTSWNITKEALCCTPLMKLHKNEEFKGCLFLASNYMDAIGDEKAYYLLNQFL
jgi:hypothetical protein